MTHWIKQIGLGVVAGLALFGFTQTTNHVLADGSPNFSVAIIINELQTKDNLGYFDLTATPNTKTVVKFKLFNNANQAATFDVAAQNAITNPNLVIDYVSAKASAKQITGPYFTDMASVSASVVTVPANAMKEIDVTVQTPAAAFNGQVMGGVRITKQLTATESSQMGIKNKFSYVGTVILREGTQPAGTAVSLSDAKYSVINQVSNVTGVLTNTAQTYSVRGNVTQSIVNVDTGEVIKTQKSEAREIAPVSHATFKINLTEPLVAGKYELRLTMDVAGKKNVLIQPFVVTATSALQNRMLMVNQWLWLIILLIILLLLAIFIIIFLVWKRKKDRDKADRLALEKTE